MMLCIGLELEACSVSFAWWVWVLLAWLCDTGSCRWHVFGLFDCWVVVRCCYVILCYAFWFRVSVWFVTLVGLALDLPFGC